ncbi:uncharacterized protein LOC133182890 [Saccostrea echinata]|uniref:uncharacterized protein LOC133182890 n=1 Tax=Saccostrea echinata TaxID=191078 RepID=UPI002A80CE5A|nr:uncharacterized protein LOC133182890 [Saccostrea echinata]
MKQILLRLLERDEDPSQGLRPKDPNSRISIEDHVTYGSYLQSRYISCCKTINGIKRLRKKSRTFPQRVVKIEIDSEDPTINEIIDLTKPEILEQYIKKDNKEGRCYARMYEEVLIDGSVPPSCVIEITESLNDADSA